MADPELLVLASTFGIPADLLEAVAGKCERLFAAATDDAGRAEALEPLVAALGNDAASPEMCEQYSHHADNSVRAAAVRSGKLTGGRAHEMMDDPSAHVLFELARLDGLDESDIDTLALHGDPVVRLGVPENPGTSVETLKRLCADPDAKVAEAAREWCESRGIKVEHPDEPADPAMAAPGGMVMPGMPGMPGAQPPADAPLTPAEVDALLAGETLERRKAAGLAELPDGRRVDVLVDEAALVRAAFAKRDDLTDAEQDAILADTDPVVLAAFALNRDADEARRNTLADHEVDRVRSAVARTTTDRDLQLALAGDASEDVHEQLAVRIEELDADVVVTLSRSSSRKVRKQVALNRDEIERLDGLWACELVEWKVSSYKERLAHLAQGETYAQALELAPDFAGSLEDLVTLAGALV